MFSAIFSQRGTTLLTFYLLSCPANLFQKQSAVSKGKNWDCLLRSNFFLVKRWPLLRREVEKVHPVIYRGSNSVIYILRPFSRVICSLRKEFALGANSFL